MVPPWVLDKTEEVAHRDTVRAGHSWLDHPLANGQRAGLKDSLIHKLVSVECAERSAEKVREAVHLQSEVPRAGLGVMNVIL